MSLAVVSEAHRLYIYSCMSLFAKQWQNGSFLHIYTVYIYIARSVLILLLTVQQRSLMIKGRVISRSLLTCG